MKLPIKHTMKYVVYMLQKTIYMYNKCMFVRAYVLVCCVRVCSPRRSLQSGCAVASSVSI